MISVVLEVVKALSGTRMPAAALIATVIARVLGRENEAGFAFGSPWWRAANHWRATSPWGPIEAAVEAAGGGQIVGDIEPGHWHIVQWWSELDERGHIHGSRGRGRTALWYAVDATRGVLVEGGLHGGESTADGSKPAEPGFELEVNGAPVAGLDVADYGTVELDAMFAGGQRRVARLTHARFRELKRAAKAGTKAAKKRRAA